MDKLRIEIAPEFKELDIEDVLAEAKANAWSEDPGQGKAVLLKDERGNPAYEVHNPMPFALPIGFEPTPPLDQLIADRVRSEFQRLKDDDVIDTEDEMNDFDVPDEIPLASVYEVIQMEDQAPALRPQNISIEERAKMHVDFMELAERERLSRKLSREQAVKKQREALEKQERELSLYSDPSPSEPPATPAS